MSFNYTRKNAYDYDSVKKAQADLNANSTYNKSSAVLAAERLKKEHEANKLADWTGGSYGEALKNPAIVKMAEKYGVSAAQLCIRYVLQLGAVALPKTADPAHMESNADVDFVISEEDMETLKNMERIANYGNFSAFPVFNWKPLA